MRVGIWHEWAWGESGCGVRVGVGESGRSVRVG